MACKIIPVLTGCDFAIFSGNPLDHSSLSLNVKAAGFPDSHSTNVHPLLDFSFHNPLWNEAGESPFLFPTEHVGCWQCYHFDIKFSINYYNDVDMDMVKDVPQPSSKEKRGLCPKYLTRQEGANILGMKTTRTNVLIIWKTDEA